jgi:hypothetical protein
MNARRYVENAAKFLPPNPACSLLPARVPDPRIKKIGDFEGNGCPAGRFTIRAASPGGTILKTALSLPALGPFLVNSQGRRTDASTRSQSGGTAPNCEWEQRKINRANGAGTKKPRRDLSGSTESGP